MSLALVGFVLCLRVNPEGRKWLLLVILSHMPISVARGGVNSTEAICTESGGKNGSPEENQSVVFRKRSSPAE